MSASDILKALAVTAELTQTELSATALRVMASDLQQFPEDSVIRALTRCRKELKHKLTLADILDRISEGDGRPSADEAWATALIALDEAETVIWTEEARQAFAIARPVLSVGDKVGARMAFRDAYDRIVLDNREKGIGAVWAASLGWDKDRRAAALKRAESAGLLPSQVVSVLLPAATGGVIEQALFGGNLLSVPVSDDDAEIARRRCAELKSMLTGRVSA